MLDFSPSPFVKQISETVASKNVVLNSKISTVTNQWASELNS